MAGRFEQDADNIEGGARGEIWGNKKPGTAPTDAKCAQVAASKALVMPCGPAGASRRLLGRRPRWDVLCLLRFAVSLRKPWSRSLRCRSHITTCLLSNALFLDVFAMRDEVSRKRVRDVHESILLLASVSVQFCDYSGITVQSATA